MTAPSHLRKLSFRKKYADIRSAVAAIFLIFYSAHASAHGSGLLFFVFGIPFAAVSYLILAVVFVKTSKKQDRTGATLAWLFGLPVWGLLYIGAMFNYEQSLNEEWWTFGVPSFILFLSILCLFRDPSKVKEKRIKQHWENKLWRILLSVIFVGLWLMMLFYV